MKKNFGQIQVYTGTGKGKTTAALGLAMRARGSGARVAIIFFDKGGNDYNERKILAQIGVDYWVTGEPRFNARTKKFRFGVNKLDRNQGRHGLDILQKIFTDKEYDLVILDEINSSIALGIIEEQYFLEILKQKPKNMELILTGRNASQKILAQADLVTEMKMKKHYYTRGVTARPGIEY